MADYIFKSTVKKTPLTQKFFSPMLVFSGAMDYYANIDGVTWFAKHILIIPLRIARGVQNKVLEAMSMGKTVVTTSSAVQGIHPDVKDVLESAQRYFENNTIGFT